ncbi:tyrosine-type recombinase/integrase (plasmid) [Nicoliella spurrieriana]|uniref:Tyrosine-type recombinase/integrase n=2 Tax=Nicoliella spurrieriana TaxID=2925830 RepID=A0A976RR53_9LACO|nr:tyrosine-type recombinase/integrase [Nicoliella spurrieriana]UQS86230.1 tyrosine-type recombinase/integrase [Nicoliella spurrieriana]
MNYPTINPPKSKSGNRVVQMNRRTMLLLKKWQLKQRIALLSDGLNAKSSNAFVFSTNGKSMYTARTVRYWQQSIYKHNPSLKRITIHGFRHTHASMLFSAGISVKEVQVRLGHANPQITLGVYTHVTKE